VTHAVELFWDHLLTLPTARYPDGVDPVFGCLRGTAAFAASAGLYWPDPFEPLPEFPVEGEGVMLVGNNLDGTANYQIRLDKGEPHGDPRFPRRLMRTWRNLYLLVDDAGVRRERCFFTNAYVGLNRTGPTATFAGERDNWFRAWCHDFLAQQISVMRPRTVVALGAPARDFLVAMTGDRDHWRPVATTTSIDGIPIRAVALSHPSRRLTSTARLDESKALARAVL
jgi:hypothetical protein